MSARKSDPGLAARTAAAIQYGINPNPPEKPKRHSGDRRSALRARSNQPSTDSVLPIAAAPTIVPQKGWIPLGFRKYDENFRQEERRKQHVERLAKNAQWAAESKERVLIILGSHQRDPAKWPLIARALCDLPQRIGHELRPDVATTIADNLLLEAFRSGTFEDEKWYSWKVDLTSHPDFNSAVILLKKYAAALGVVVPPFRKHPWRYLLDGCSLMAKVIGSGSAIGARPPHLTATTLSIPMQKKEVAGKLGMSPRRFSQAVSRGVYKVHSINRQSVQLELSSLNPADRGKFTTNQV